jgi:hypothetical protein
MSDAAAAPRRHGKRKIADARGRFVAVRCSDAEYATVTAAAAQAGLSVGAYLRQQALGNPGKRSVRRPPAERAELARLLGELGRIGGNINQIARALNTSGNMPPGSDVSAISIEVQAMRAALMTALGREP